MSDKNKIVDASESVSITRNDTGYMCLTCFLRGSRDNIANHCATVHDNANYDLEIVVDQEEAATQVGINEQHSNDKDSTNTLFDTLSLEDISSDDGQFEDAVTPVTDRINSENPSAEPEQ